MADAEASEGGLERAAFLCGRSCEPLAEPARRGVHADLAARFSVDERASLETMLRRFGVGHVVLSTDGNWLLALAARLRILGRAA